MAKKLSNLLAELSEKAKNLEERFALAKTGTRQQLQKWKDDAEQKLAEDQIAFEEKKEALEDNVRSHWDAVKQNFEDGVAKVKAHYREARYEARAANAELNAEWAEDDAEMSVYFALDALADAERAIIDAVRARMEADAY